jgi:hypothetical protein
MLLSVRPSCTKCDKLRSTIAIGEVTVIDQALTRVLCDTLTQTNDTLKAIFQIKLYLYWFLSPTPLHKHLSLLLFWKIKNAS